MIIESLFHYQLIIDIYYYRYYIFIVNCNECILQVSGKNDHARKRVFRFLSLTAEFAINPRLINRSSSHIKSLN